MSEGRKQVFGLLETGRFVAASIVVLTHFCGDLAHYAAPGTGQWLNGLPLPAPLAVQYFFVLSGFVMMTAHRQDFGDLSAIPRFWWRRICRIYPMYWLALGLVLVTLHPPLSAHRFLTLVSLRPGAAAEFVSPAWTLRYEIAFYISFGLCLLPYIGRPLLGLWVLAVFWLWRPARWEGLLICPATVALGHLSFHNQAFFSPFEFYFFAGLAAGALPIAGRAAGLALIATGLIGLIALGPFYGWGLEYGTPLASAATSGCYAALMLGCAALERSQALCLGPWAARLGAISYPLYILHTAIMFVLALTVRGAWHLHGATFYAFSLVYLAAIFALATAAAFLLDRPLQRALRRLTPPQASFRPVARPE